MRLAVGAALTLAMLAALGAVGGLGYAAHAAKSAASDVFSANKPDSAGGWVRVTSGGDQYVPGYGFGDQNHNHTGPPGLQQAGSQRPPLHVRRGRTCSTVTTAVRVDEQADLFFSVIKPNGQAVTLSQRRSRIGQGVSGPNTKSIRYRVLVPRTIPVVLCIPRGQLAAGRTYRIRVIARDPDGNKTTKYIRFRA